MFARHLLLVLLFSGLASGLIARAQEGRLLVLSVGVEPDLSAKGKNDPYANDAGHVAAAFEAARPLYKNVLPRVINGNDAIKANVQRAVQGLAASLREEDLGIVFFSCHGSWSAKDGYVISLAKSGREHTQLSGGELLDILGRSKGRVIVFVDTCCAAGLVPNMPRMSYTNVSMITACKRDEGSSGSGPSIKKPHGCYVVALTEALKGFGDANSDGVVTLGEVQGYLPDRARELYNEQNAVSIIRQGAGAIPLTKVDTTNKTAKPEAVAGARNPFGLPDIDRPAGKEATEFARATKFPGGKDDENASNWASVSVPQTDTIEGRWSSRWRNNEDAWQEGNAIIKIAGDRVFIMHFDGSSRHMIEARKVNEQRLVGSYVTAGDEENSIPWTGRILNNGRIDGAWTGGRWDFKRKFE